MAHSCDACVVTCEDFRLHQRADGANVIGEYIRRVGAGCDLITRAGGVQDLVRPEPGADGSLLRDLAVSVHLHQVRAVYLVNHEDCGAYGHFGFASREEELRQHTQDLRAARDVLEKRFPGVAVVPVLAEIDPAAPGGFGIKPVE